MRMGVLGAAFCALVAVDSAHAQRLLEEWQVRPTAGAEAFASGAPAVFWNPAQVSIARGRFDAALLDLRAPGITGVSGVAVAGAARLDERTVIGVGFEHIGVDGIEETTTSPDAISTLDVGESRFAAGASHALSARLHVGAAVQYTRLPAVSEHTSVLALVGGLRYQPVARIPLTLAAMAATDGDDERWLAGVELASEALMRDVVVKGQYGAAGGQLAPGVTHRVAATAEWRSVAELTLGVVSEPDGAERSLQPVLGAGVGVHRYRLGLVRESLPNDFGAAYSFRFSVGF